MIVLHGWFDLKENVEEVEFCRSFDRFVDHLRTTNMVRDGRRMRHQAHDGYNSHPPWAQYYVSIEFLDMDCAERCWLDIEENEQSLKPLHAAVFSSIQNYRFSLTTDI